MSCAISKRVPLFNFNETNYMWLTFVVVVVVFFPFSAIKIFAGRKQIEEEE